MIVTCPDWRPLLAHRFDATRATPVGWSEAETHLGDCAECRRVALAIDPTLAFRDCAAWISAPGESTAILQAVRTLRRTADFESRTGQITGQVTGQLYGEEEHSEQVPRGRASDHGPLAAAALFALVLAFQPATTGRIGIGIESIAVVEPVPAAGPRRAGYPAAPAIEGVDRPGARVYVWGAEDLSVVMVVDESLDV